MNVGHQYWMTGCVPIEAKNMAGPGHKPEIPQPTPNKIPPKTKFASIVAFLGMLQNELEPRGADMEYLFGMTPKPSTNW